MTGFTDWQNLGILPLQDHEFDVPVGLRKQVVGGRIVSMTDPAENSDPQDSLVEYGKEGGLGTLGDVHPWMFWQTKSRSARDNGSWAQCFASMIVAEQAGGSGPTTGDPGDGAAVLPIRSQFYESDERYAAQPVTIAAGLPIGVRGQLVVMAPATMEDFQRNLVLNADPRLWAPAVSGPGEAGTLVCDLQPTREACMDGSEVPGVGGRHARLQSLVRVIAFDENGGENWLGSNGNGLALNFSQSPDGMVGWGMVWTRLSSGRPTSNPTTPGGGTSNPTTPGGGTTNPTTGPRNPQPGVPAPSGGNGTTGLEDGPQIPGREGYGKDLSAFGRFRPQRAGGHGIACLSSGMSGPIHGGHEDDKHFLGRDRDGNPINSGHLAVGAYWYRDVERDGPMLFEGDYPNPGPLPLQSRVHLTWDGGMQHPFVTGTRQGYWRWWAEVPYITPTTPPNLPPPNIPPPPPNVPPTGGPNPPTPGGPRPPGPGTPTTGGGPRAPGQPQPRRSGPPRSNPTTPNPWGPRGPRFPGYPVTGGPVGPGQPVPSGGDGNPDPLPEPQEDPPTPTTGPRDPRPGVPIPSGGAGVPVDPWSGEFAPPGAVGTVGSVTSESRQLYAIHHPMMETWAGMAFRPQLWAAGRPHFLHGPTLGAERMRADEELRPQVVALHTWGRQNADTEWDYAEQPRDSRARGGVVAGGVLFTPPQFEPEDYFSIGESRNVLAPVATGYVAVAPGIAFALGTPNLDGGMEARSVTLSQALTGDRAVTLAQLDSTRTARTLLSGSVSQSSGEVLVAIGGTAAVTLPRGTTAQRPASPVAGQIRVNSSGANDVVEFYDGNGAAWTSITGGGGGGGGVSDGDKGDITVSGGGTVWTIDNQAVSYAKIQNVSATDRLLGRSTAGAGVIEEITCTAFGRSLLDDADASAARTTLGLVIGTNVQAYDAELAALAGLTSAADRLPYFTGAGTAALATFTTFGRSLVDDADAASARTTMAAAGSGAIGSSGLTMSTARLLGRTTAATGAVEEITVGSGLSLSAGVLSATGGGGVVSDGDYGDIVVSSSGSVWTIDAGVVDTSKLGGDITTAGKALLDDASASAQRTTLGLGSLAVENVVPISKGGTGQTSQGPAFAALAPSVGGGNHLLCWDNVSSSWVGVDLTGYVDGDVLQVEAGSTGGVTARTLGTLADRNSINNGDWSGTDLSIANGGTGASDAPTARTNLGAAASGAVTSSGLTVSATDRLLGRQTAGSGAVEEITCTAAGRALIDDADAAAQRTTLSAARQLSEQFVEWFDDLDAPTMTWFATTTGTGASASTGTDHVNATENAIGEVVLALGTTASSRAGIYKQADGILFGTAAFTLEWRGTVGALSTAADEFVLHWGFIDNPTSNAEPTNGAYFRYSRAADGDFWVCVTRDNGTETKTVTAISPADYSTLHTFSIEVNAAGSSVVFKRNGSTLATHTTNIPTAAGRRTGLGFRGYRTAYTATGRWSYIDWVRYTATRTSAR